MSPWLHAKSEISTSASGKKHGQMDSCTEGIFLGASKLTMGII